MRRLLVGLLLALSGCYEQSGGSAPAQPQEQPAPPPTAVPAAVVAEEAVDSDGDGKVDTWRRHEPDGVVVERRDTDGDGKPDQTRRLEPLEDAPPGIGLELETKQGQPEPAQGDPGR